MKSDKDLAFELQNVIGHLRKEHALKRGHLKLKGAEKHILFIICGLKDRKPATISEIANKIGITLAAVTHQINAMEEQGLVKRLPCHDDRRVVFVELTKKGCAQVAELKKEFARKTQILVEFLGEKDTKDLIRLVKKLSEFRGFAGK